MNAMGTPPWLAAQWNTSTDPCTSWAGVQCISPRPVSAVTSGSGVASLTFTAAAPPLTGAPFPLPSVWSLFPNLQSLDCSGQGLRGPVGGLGNWTATLSQLLVLKLGGNALTGPIAVPPWPASLLQVGGTRHLIHNRALSL